MEVDGQKMTCSKVAPGITAADHRRAYNDVQARYADLNTDSTGGTRFPFHFVVDPDGKVLDQIANGTKEGGFDVVSAAEFVGKLQAAHGEVRKGALRRRSRGVPEGARGGAEGEGERGPEGAPDHARRSCKKNPRTKIAGEAKKLIDEASAGGDALLKEAEGLVAATRRPRS